MFDSEYSPSTEGVQAGPVATLAARGPYDQVVESYTAAGLTLVPCDGKRPAVKEWEKLNPKRSRALRRQHGHRNVGVLGGEPSGTVFLDDDTGDPEVDALIERLFPSPWRRVGSKGAVRGYR